MKHYFYAIVAALVCVAACQKEEKEDTLELSSSSFFVTSEGASQTIRFQTNNSWTVSSDKDWVTFNATSGESGDCSVVMTVDENETYDTRTATVTFSAGKKVSSINVSQTGKVEFGATVTLNVSHEAQDITIATVSNVEYSVSCAEDWLTVVKTKSAPEEGSIVIHVDENNTVESRSGYFEVYTTDGKYSQKYVVTQSTEYQVLTSAAGYHLGRVQRICNTETGEYTTDNQFAVVLSDETTTVTLVLNEPDTAIGIEPGEYTTDATGARLSYTFSLKSTDGNEKYYTRIVSSGAETAVYDGVISVEASDGEYTIIAKLSDAAENIHSYMYQGPLSFEDKTFGAQISGAEYAGIYNTYFTTKANAYDFIIYVSKAAADGQAYLRYLNVTLYTQAGDVDKTSLPEGTFTYEYPEEDASQTYASGITNAKPGTFFISYGYTDLEDSSIEVAEGSTPELKITSKGNGLYDITLTGKFNEVKSEYDEDWNETRTVVSTFDYNGEFADVYAKVSDGSYAPIPDGDAVFNSVLSANYVSMWFGDAFNTSNNVFVLAFQYVNSNYIVYLTLNVKGDWTFEKNYQSKYCNTPFHTGTFNFSSTAADDTILPAKYLGNCYCYVQNGYTGTKMPISGGSVTFTDTSVEYDLKATSPVDGNTYKFTGSHAATFYYARDYSARASMVTL